MEDNRTSGAWTIETKGPWPPSKFGLRGKKAILPPPFDKFSWPPPESRGDPWLFSTGPPSLANLQAPLNKTIRRRDPRMVTTVEAFGFFFYLGALVHFGRNAGMQKSRRRWWSATGDGEQILELGLSRQTIQTEKSTERIRYYNGFCWRVFFHHYFVKPLQFSYISRKWNWLKMHTASA